jgi:hypothetical protein
MGSRVKSGSVLVFSAVSELPELASRSLADHVVCYNDGVSRGHLAIIVLQYIKVQACLCFDLSWPLAWATVLQTHYPLECVHISRIVSDALGKLLESSVIASTTQKAI